MIDTRLALALSDAGLCIPEKGDIAVFRPPEVAQLPHLGRDRTEVIHDFKPLYDSWAARGYRVACQPGGDYAASIVCLPRAKEEARALFADACALTRGPVVIDGQKTDGIDSILKAVKARTGVHGPISKSHGKLFWIERPPADLLGDWAAGPARTAGGFWTAPGVFSADGIDLASAMLADALPDKMGGAVADLGAGWGFLSAHVLTRPDVTAVHLVEAGYMAVECAKRNVTDPRAQFHWADVPAWTAPASLDTVVMNPPFHQTRAAEPQIGRGFIAAARGLLTARGTLWMVANRHLPYEADLTQHFAQVDEIGGDARFKLFCARRPRNPRSTR
ncbi:MAG: class I SAM-dependent methyltransferase [Pseudomonadota bacterium]